MAVDDFFRLMFSLPSVEGILQWGFWDKARATWNKMVKIKSYDTGSLAGERRIGERGQLWSERGWPGVPWPLPQVRNDSWCNYNDKPFWDFMFNTTSAVSFEFISSSRLIQFFSNCLVVSVVGSGILALNSNQDLMDRLPQGDWSQNERKVIIWLAY